MALPLPEANSKVRLYSLAFDINCCSLFASLISPYICIRFFPHFIAFNRLFILTRSAGFLLSTANSFEGEVLGLARVSRLHIGAYLCIASNGVPPSVSKRIVLNVQCKEIR